jgi:hypothetical protein
LRNAVDQRNNEASRRARIKRVALRQAVDAVLSEHRVVALLYPTLRRKPARIGDGQGGSNCQLSAHSGLPALAVAAGVSDDGVPIGMDLLGGAFTESDLLSLGYAIGQTLNLRRKPFSTPGLVEGERPAPRTTTVAFQGVVLALSYDETTSRLQYSISGGAATVDRLAAVWIHAGTPAKPGAARHQLYGPDRAPAGTVTLAAADRRGLSEGGLLARFFLRDGRGSAADLPVSFRK